VLKTSNIGISLFRLAKLLIALIAIYKVSSLLVSSSSKEIILYKYTLIGTSLTLIAITFIYY